MSQERAIPWTEAQTAAMQSVYDALCKIQRAIHPHNRPPVDLVEASLLKSLGVIVSDLPIDSRGHIDMEPRYIDPLPEAEMDSLFHTYLGPPGQERCWSLLAWPKYQPEEASPRKKQTQASEYEHKLATALSRGIFLGDPDDVDPPSKHLLEESAWSRIGLLEPEISPHDESCLNHEKGGDAKWWSQGTYVLSSKISPKDPLHRRPHIQFSLVHPAPFHGLFTSELLCIIVKMKMQIANPMYALAGHRLFPVILYTYNGPTVRITQAIYDNGFLQIRQSPGFDITCNDDDFSPVKLIMRWTLGKPCGHTLWAREEEHSQIHGSPIDPLLPTSPMSCNITVGA